jgi:pectate lyase
MKNVFIILLVVLTAAASWAVPVFPGAEGYAAEAPGGRGGRVIVVTSTLGGGAGSLSAALMATGPRIIVFRVSGEIPMNVSSFGAAQSFVTVAGHTSPGGVTMTKSGGTILSSYRSGLHDMVLRHLRMRGSNSTYDNISLNSCYNIFIDHCDFSGSSDEAFDITFSYDFTVSWCTIANSGQGQTYGALIAYTPTSNVSLHHNLFAHHVHRGGPHMHWGSQPASETAIVQYINNICYNNQNCRFLDASAPTGSAQWNFAGNYYKAGPNTGSNCLNGYPPANIAGGSNVSIYDTDNIWIKSDGSQSTDVLDLRYSSPNRVSTPFNMPAVTTYSAQANYDTVLDKVGAWPRDDMNTRTVNDVRTKTGSLRDLSESNITSGPIPPDDADMDGMPDFWETGMGFNPNDSAGKNSDHDNDGYTNIEEYINDLALARLCEDYYNPVYPIPNNWADYNPSCCKSLADVEDVTSVNETGFLSLSPNPYSGSGKIDIIFYSASNRFDKGLVAVYSVNGRLVKTFPVYRQIGWDGRDSRGAALAPGLYVVKWQQESRLMVQQKLVVLR